MADLTTHAPTDGQHAPMGIGVQGLGEQTAPRLPAVLGSAQAVGATSVQAPLVPQQGPTDAVQGGGEQDEPKP